jgi:phosphoribosyl 1,2-cyclic phosphate phosphodiesterase
MTASPPAALKVVVLGSGGSSGTPAVDAGWGRCDPANPKNRRTRASIFVETGTTRVLIDTAPDLRDQLLAAQVARFDAVLYTHSHADHLHGIDDLRAVNRAIGAPLPTYADAHTLGEIHRRFGYALEPMAEGARYFYKPTLIPHEVHDGDAWTVGDIPITAFDQDHGFSRTLGFRLGPVAYTTDLVELPERAFAVLKGIRVWIIGTLVDHPHPTHCHVAKALSWIRRLKPEVGVLSHLGYDLDHGELAARLPVGVLPAYDGMVIEVAPDRVAVIPPVQVRAR